MNIFNIYQNLVSKPTESRQTTPWLKTTAPNPKHRKKAQKSIPIKGVISSN